MNEVQPTASEIIHCYSIVINQHKHATEKITLSRALSRMWQNQTKIFIKEHKMLN